MKNKKVMRGLKVAALSRSPPSVFLPAPGAVGARARISEGIQTSISCVAVIVQKQRTIQEASKGKREKQGRVCVERVEGERERERSRSREKIAFGFRSLVRGVCVCALRKDGIRGRDKRVGLLESCPRGVQAESLASSGEESDDGGLAPPPRKRSRSSLPTTQRPAAAAAQAHEQLCSGNQEQAHRTSSDNQANPKEMDNYRYV